MFIPEQLRIHLSAKEIAMSKGHYEDDQSSVEKAHVVDDQARREQWQAALATTFGMWADRDDIAQDGVEYVREIRHGHRLNDFLEQVDESD
jgi:hypothetical protein